MKSAYERAMERFASEEPPVVLTEEQKEALAAIDERFRARHAERELFLDDLILKARRSGNWTELAELETQKVRELVGIKNDAEAAKEKVRKP
jgi:hypothetical protein